MSDNTGDHTNSSWFASALDSNMDNGTESWESEDQNTSEDDE